MATVWGGHFDRYPPYTARVDAVDTIEDLVLLVDTRCPLLPDLLPLELSDAQYRLEPVARWYLLWDVRVAERRTQEIGEPEGQAEGVQPGAVGEDGARDLLAAWRETMAARKVC
jgi:hypothetical protein